MFIAFTIGIISVATIIYLDRYFSRRDGLVANKRFAERLDQGRRDSDLHRYGAVNRSRHNETKVILGPVIEVRKPGFLSRRRVAMDSFGRVVATHYEEMVINDVKPRFMLTPGSAAAA